MNRNTITVALIVVIVIAALWLAESPPPVFQTRAPSQEGDLVLSEYFDAMHTIQFNQQGLREQAFWAARIEQNKPADDLTADTNLTHMREPQFIFYEQNEPRWDVQALNGELSANDERVFLRDDVVLKQVDEQEPLQINTPSLWIDPNTKYANTDDEVTLTAPGFVSTGRGMTADVTNQSFSILAEVKSRYEITPR